MNERVLVVGATSAIARGVATELGRMGAALYIAARDLHELERIAADISLRTQARVHHGAFAVGHESARCVFHHAREALGGIDGIVIAVGDLGDQERARRDAAHAEAIVDANFAGLIPLLSEAAAEFEQRGHGYIVGIASVAGDRGRQSNYTYGAAKGALALYLQGLRNRLTPAGVTVLTVKPGFVDTRMTFGMPGLFLLASPAAVAERIVRARKQARVLYVPGFWLVIMTIIRLIPEGIFRRLRL